MIEGLCKDTLFLGAQTMTVTGESAELLCELRQCSSKRQSFKS